MALAESAPVPWVPLVLLAPLQAPEAVQDVALVVDQVSVLASPTSTLVGEALIDTVGAGATVTTAVWVTLPPLPEQARV